MSRLAGFKHRQVFRRLKRLGFALDRKAAGSHEIWYHSGTGRYITVPRYSRDLSVGTLRAIIRQAGVTVEEFLDS